MQAIDHIFKFHIQDGARQRTGPGTGARQRDAHKQQQRHHQATPGLGFQRAAAFFALVDAEAAERRR